MLTWEEARAMPQPGELGLLMSYWFFRDRPPSYFAALSRRYSLFIDSGAFTAAVQGVDIDAATYSRWLQPRRRFVRVAAALDVIHDPPATLRNWTISRAVGADVAPVVHLGADPNWLRRYADAGCRYAALGGMVRASGAIGIDRNEWIDRCHTVATDVGIGLHGFGLTSEAELERWPWASADSTSWRAGRKFGSAKLYDPERGWISEVNLRALNGDQMRILRMYGIDPFQVRDVHGVNHETTKAIVLSYVAHQRYIRRTNPRFQLYLASVPQDVNELKIIFGA